jgi:hypothetical protein
MLPPNIILLMYHLTEVCVVVRRLIQIVVVGIRTLQPPTNACDKYIAKKWAGIPFIARILDCFQHRRSPRFAAWVLASKDMCPIFIAVIATGASSSTWVIPMQFMIGGQYTVDQFDIVVALFHPLFKACTMRRPVYVPHFCARPALS